MDFTAKWMLSLLVSIFMVGFLKPLPGDVRLPAVPVKFSDGLQIEAEVAFTDETRARGLMYRKSMPNDSGMLFVFPDLDLHSFWMKNTHIPLDMLWLNERREVVYFVTATPCKADPCASYRPMQKAMYVLEVNAGFVKKNGVKLGDVLDFTIPPHIASIVESQKTSR